jgi:hypothetical protein
MAWSSAILPALRVARIRRLGVGSGVEVMRPLFPAPRPA